MSRGYLSPDGSRLAVRLWRPELRPIPERVAVWDVATGEPLADWDTGADLGWLRFSADGTQIGGIGHRAWHGYSFPDGRPLRRVDVGGQVPDRLSDYDFSDDGTGLVVLSAAESAIRVYDLNDGIRQVRQFGVTPGATGRYRRITRSADGRLLAVWPSDGNAPAEFYGLADGRRMAVQQAGPDSGEPSFADGGRLLVEVQHQRLGANDNALVLIDTATGAVVGRRGNDGVWWGARVAAGGTAIVSGGLDWLDLPAADVAVSLRVDGQRASSNYVAISGDGQRVAALLRDGWWAVWDVGSPAPGRRRP